MNKHCDSCTCWKQPTEIEGAQARVFGIPVYQHVIVPEGQIWIGPSAASVEELIKTINNLLDDDASEGCGHATCGYAGRCIA